MSVRLTVCVSVPLVAVTVIGSVPAGVAPIVVIVSCALPVPLMEVGLKVAIAPLGKPVAARLATPEYPLCPAMLMVYVVEAPGCNDWLAGEAVIAKSATGLTTSVAEAVWVNVPLDALMVSGKVPTGVVVEVLTTSLALPDPVTDCGVNVAVAPAGNPVSARLAAEA